MTIGAAASASGRAACDAPQRTLTQIRAPQSKPDARRAAGALARTLVECHAARRGRTGAHILLRTSPGQSTTNPYAPTAIGANSSVEISGRLLPGKAGRHRGGRALHTIAAVTTGAGGRSGPTGWRPGGRGTYELWASYPAQPRGVVADSTSCPLRFAAG